jgi:2-hydroxychromene-2-carboxylate isomerase
MKTIDYYMTPGSPWTYLGHGRFEAIAKEAGAAVNVKPVDYGVIFPQSGGLPLAKRAPQRQAYRFQELKRWRARLGVELILQPKHFPVDAGPAAQLIAAAPEEKRMALAWELLAALWRDDKNIADPALLKEIGARHGVAAGDKAKFEAYTQEALGRGIFGAPSYMYKDELFWGQDRLEFLERTLQK